MLSEKHDITAAELSKPYEENQIGLRGIVSFAIGLLLLIVITFGLMWALLNVFKNNAEESAKAGPQNPMMMKEIERLPPEPRLQLAPGFGVDSEHGKVNLELNAPASEYLELRKQWETMWLKGAKDEKTGTVTMLPIEEAKQRFLSQNAKAKNDPASAELWSNSRSYISDSSAGRLASEKRR
jgi:hypothetical protein